LIKIDTPLEINRVQKLPLQNISKIFNEFVPLSKEEFAIIVRQAKLINVPKKTKLLKIGEVCNHMYFVLSGCLRLYYIKEEISRNCFFFHENLFCTAFGSFMMRRPSNQILETIILEERYANAHDILSSFILHSPEERYLEFINKYPLLVNRIPEYHISSYLGITPKSFSRLKGRLRNRSRKEKNSKKVNLVT